MNAVAKTSIGIVAAIVCLSALLYALFNQSLHLATNDLTAYQPLLFRAAVGLLVAAISCPAIWLFGGKLRWLAAVFGLGIVFLAYDWVQRYPHVFI